MRREVAQQALVDCERAYYATRRALDHFQEASRKRPGLLLTREFRPGDLERATKELESTHLFRLFAIFEGILRDFWASRPNKSPKARILHILNGTASMMYIQSSVLGNAHKVREYRNALAHPHHVQTQPMTFGQAKSSLARFLAGLPREWR